MTSNNQSMIESIRDNPEQYFGFRAWPSPGFLLDGIAGDAVRSAKVFDISVVHPHYAIFSDENWFGNNRNLGLKELFISLVFYKEPQNMFRSEVLLNAVCSSIYAKTNDEEYIKGERIPSSVGFDEIITSKTCCLCWTYDEDYISDVLDRPIQNWLSK